MAKRWVIGGLAVGVSALVLAPEARTWLRRRLGLEPEDRRWFEEDEVTHSEHEGDEPLDTREARFSLRARLAEEGQAEPLPAEPSFPAFEEPAPRAPDFPAFEEPAPEPAAAEPAPEPEPAPFTPPAPEPRPVFGSYESVPAITPEADAPKTPGEDTNEIEPLPPASSEQPPAEPEQSFHDEAPAEQAPPPPPTLLRPATAAFPNRPFSSESSSFRSAIDAARERVHGAAREATPDEGDSTEPIDEQSS